MERNDFGSFDMASLVEGSRSLIRSWKELGPEGVTIEDELLLALGGVLVLSVGKDLSDGFIDNLHGVISKWKKQKADEINTVEVRREIAQISETSMYARASRNAQHCFSEAATMADDVRCLTAQHISGVWARVARVTERLRERVGQKTGEPPGGDS
jgi:hypothetical protein